ncbi:uncharacterized protein Z518_04141 [Rhinocladiella mackenziei CBS 650.93]|uniref:Uncharacterized protein n=1 Tax=Rhinocladiella mackenziei CBS 650.93 TaxID=1442369 RepID=A0A0D2FVH7_9EURO|nr:uncharacterized protein Z518_04141 [Rhinocladiella mackenziei CBS 650.93]KIX06167.1 hypothetical protein Z518_04141 [Rhinocladiella mackenziei CBS 650.93]
MQASSNSCTNRWIYEVTEPFLRICSGAPAVVNDTQLALQKDEHGSYQRIPYVKVLRRFKLSDLSVRLPEKATYPRFVDLLITTKKNTYTLIEFKNIQLPYLGLDGDNSDRAKQLETMGLEENLGLRFKKDKFRSGTIRNRVDGRGRSQNSGNVRKQLQSYIKGPSVQREITDKNFRAFAVIIVGSRQILVREMDRHGKWVSGIKLAWNGQTSGIKLAASIGSRREYRKMDMKP